MTVKLALYDWFGLNRALFDAINGLHASWLDPLMLLGTRLGDFWNLPWLAGGVALSLLMKKHLSSAYAQQQADRPALSLETLLGLLFGYALTMTAVTLLKLGVDMPRPLVALPLGAVHVLGKPELRYSLPSGHAAFGMLVAVVLWPVVGRTSKGLLAAFVVWVGLSRINVGAHFPADIVAGYLCGLASGLLANGWSGRGFRRALVAGGGVHGVAAEKPGEGKDRPDEPVPAALCRGQSTIHQCGEIRLQFEAHPGTGKGSLHARMPAGRSRGRSL